MNTRALPLALALGFSLALPASAGTTAGSPFNFGGTSNLFSGGGTTGPTSVSDMVINCDTPPYRQCTAEEAAQKRSYLGSCDRVGDARCQGAHVRNGGFQSPIQQMGQTPDVEWADPNCARIPCAVKSNARTGPTNASAPVPQPGDFDFMGPMPLNQAASGPQPFSTDADFQQAMREQRELTPENKVIDLGDRRYALVFPDGTASIGGTSDGKNGLSGMPKPIAQIPGLQAKIDYAAANENMFASNDTGSNKSAGGPTSPNPERTGTGGNNTTTPPPGVQDGEGVGAVANNNGGGGGGVLDSLRTGNGSGRGSGGQVAGNDSTVSGTATRAEKGEAPVLSAIKTTFVKTQAADSVIQRERSRMESTTVGSTPIFVGSKSNVSDNLTVTNPNPTVVNDGNSGSTPTP